MEFAKSHMVGKGWSEGVGLGRHGQGITDAIKPKLKFDQSGIGHSKADEFEFQWWDHAFNKAAKSVKVEEGQDGQVKVDFNSSKNELSTKKIRRKAEKAMKKEVKAKLYSNFVKSGTLTGGKMEEAEEGDSGFVEDKDLSLLRTLTDDELVKACGGRTAHKGGRHGHRMNAKLARIEKAEAEYMLNHKSKEEAAAALAEDRVGARLAEDKVCTRLIGEGDNVSSGGGGGKDEVLTEDLTEVKRKKKKRKRDKNSDEGNIEHDDEIIKGDDTSEVAASTIVEPKRKKKKSKKGEDNIENEEPQEEADVLKKKKSKKSKKLHETSISEEVSLKKKNKKSKRKKLKGGSD